MIITVVRFIILASILPTANSIECIPGLCEYVLKKPRKPLHCKGSVLKKGGFCGCTDACAKLEGEPCQAARSVYGFAKAGLCDKGLKCSTNGVLLGIGRCIAIEQETKKMTLCETMKKHNMLSWIVWSEQWLGPRCDKEGFFLPHQCDRSGYCFCVTAKEGKIVPHSKVHGPADCL